MKNIRSYLIAFLLLFYSTTFAGSQSSAPMISTPYNSRVAKADFNNYTIDDAAAPTVISSFIQKQISNLQSKNAGLQLTFSSTSLAAYHYSFDQTYLGIPIWQSEIKVNAGRNNVVFAMFDNSYDISKWSVNTTDFNYQSVASYQAYVKSNFSTATISDAHKTIVYNDSTEIAQLCYDVMLKDVSGKQHELIVSRTAVLYDRDASMYFAPQPASDSVVHGLVYRPDPITTADTFYGGNYVNNGDSDNPKLTAQEVPVTFTASFVNDSFYLQNQYLQMTNLGNLVNPVVLSVPNFNFTRSQNGFEDVMVFYHLTLMRNYFHSLGFTFADTLLYADAHATTQDNSYFATPNTLRIGTGGVPDGQDCDVFVHEFTHFASWNANHSNTGTVERAGLDEGTADYDATSYSRSISDYQWYWVFNWDGHNEYWPGRIVNDMTVYPALPSAPSGLYAPYTYGTMWASSLQSIWTDLGRGVADSLAFEALYSYGTSTTLLQAAQIVIKADSMLFNGIYHCDIVRDFALHGLASDAVCGVYPAGINPVAPNTDLIKFIAYPDGFTAVSSQTNEPVAITLYNMTGQKLANYSNVTTEIKPAVPVGIYIIEVTIGGQHQGFKWAHVY